MSARWMTKYGPRRVRVEPPTFEEALDAAEGLTADRGQQIGIAAELMHMPLEEAQAAAEHILKTRATRKPTVQSRRALSNGTVVVERRPSRRLSREAPSSRRAGIR